MRTDNLRVLRLHLSLLLSRRPSLDPDMQRALCDARPVVTRASRNLRSVRVVARVIRVWLGAAQRTSRRGDPKLAGQLPDLHRRKPDASVTAVVTRCPEAALAPHAVRLFYAIVCVMVVITRCG
jgi:hypothetical protein